MVKSIKVCTTDCLKMKKIKKYYSKPKISILNYLEFREFFKFSTCTFGVKISEKTE